MSTAASLNPSRLGAMKARFQQKQLQEKEEKLTALYEKQQQRTLERVVKSRTGRIQYGGRSSGPLSGETSPGGISSSSTTSSTSSQKMIGNGRVRQMFEERRVNVPKAGIDKSYPLAPINAPKSSTKKAINRNHSLDRTFTKDENFNHNIITSKLENLQILQNSGDLSPLNKTFEILETNNNIDTIDSENFPEVQLIDDDLDVSFGKLPNVVRALPSERIKNNIEPVKRNVVRPTNGLVRKPTTRLGAGDGKLPETKKTEVKKNNTRIRNPPIRKTEPISKSSPKVSPTHTTIEMQTAAVPPVITARKLSASPIKGSIKSGGIGAATRDDLASCQYCNRRFATDRLSKHQEICAKMTQKKRKPYDALKHRVVGTEAEAYVKKGIRQQSKKAAQPAAQQQSAKKNDWRRKHEEFIAAIRAAKQVQEHLAKGGNIRDLPPPPPSSNPDYVACPHCGRKFNQGAADRHIPKCANYSFNKKPTAKKMVSKR